MALTGFFTIGLVMLIGFVAAHLGVLTSDHQKLMAKLAFTVASPPLMLTLLKKADMSHVFSITLIASAGAIVISGLTYLVLARLVFHPDRAGATIGWMLSCYTNAGNLGLPVAAYALGDMTWMAPILLIQMVIMQPTALALLDIQRTKASGGRLSWVSIASIPFKNPLTVGTLIGLFLNLAHIDIPGLLLSPLEMVGAMAVPTMLIAFGVSIRLDPKPTRSPDSRETAIAVVLKCFVMPAAALAIGYALHLPAGQLRAVTVIAALPPAQNIFIIATRYDVRTLFARDAIFWATPLAAVVILAAASLL